MKGNLFYITELQGINKYGELFFSYYFKELHSNMVSEKLTYAKLYKDFNWVIAMGTYQKDIQSYIDQTNKESKALASRLIFILGFLFIIIMVISYAIVMFIEKLNYRHSKKLLESEINQDSLTKADSRRNGTKELNNAFKEYRKNGTNAGIMMFDIDYFKNINDTYGHAVGDLVLVEIVNAIYRIIRSSDKLIRWGGDEFIVIFYGLQVENAIIFGNKILSVASSLNVSVEGKVINPTLSIGFSYFKEMDTDFLDVLKRVDQALYESKTKGRNQVSLLL
jgi:diguanylate cyclase (GGDEF)-like protein